MSKEEKKPSPKAPTPEKIMRPPVTFNITRDQFTNAIGNAKRRISQRKGEVIDTLGDQITQEFVGLNNAIMGLFDQIDALTARIKELESNQEPKQ